MPTSHALADEVETSEDDGNRDLAEPESGVSMEGIARGRRRYRPPKPPVLKVGILPVARRDTERLRQVLSMQRRLLDLRSSARARRALWHRGPFAESITWLDVHGHVPDIVEHWRGFIEALETDARFHEPPTEEQAEVTTDQPRRRRRRRRRGGRRHRGREGNA
jgi:hypothetical protein